MSVGHAVRGAASAGLALVVLQAVTTNAGSGRVGSFFTDVSNLLARAVSPETPLIRDRRAGADTANPYLTAANARAAARVAQNLPAVGAITGPGGIVGPSLGQYTAGGGLPGGIANNPALRGG